MPSLHDAKRRVAAMVTRLPPRLGRGLMRLNRRPHWVFGGEYQEYRTFLDEHEHHYDNTDRLLRTAEQALRTVPWYRERYGRRRLNSLEDFESLELMSKEDLVSDWARFRSDVADPDDYETVTTGGTSGKPLTLLVPKTRYVVELATMHSLWARAGYRHHVRAVVRNHRLPEGVPYQVNPLTREVLFDGFDLTPRALDHLWETVQRLGLSYIHCYPSTAAELARHLRNRGERVDGLQAFLSGSENIFDHQRELIEGTLGVRFYNWYGHSEKLVLAGYCARTHLYHHEPTYGHLELIDAEGKVVREAGRQGEIVGTTLHNPGMPLLRYRTGDWATYVGDHCEACGRRVPVFRDVRGRWSGNRVYNADGSFVTTTALNLHDDLYQVIDGLQYHQHTPGELAVWVIPGPTYAHESRLKAHFADRLAAGSKIEIRYVSQLKRKDNGKFVLLHSSVKPEPR